MLIQKVILFFLLPVTDTPGTIGGMRLLRSRRTFTPTDALMTSYLQEEK